MEERGKTVTGASGLGACKREKPRFPRQAKGPGVEWLAGRARGSPGAAARARGGGEHSLLVLPLCCLALQQPDFPEMMRRHRPMGERKRPGGGVAEPGPGNPAKCLVFSAAAPRTRQCALLLRRGRTCSETEPSGTRLSQTKVSGPQHPWHRSLSARIAYLHRNRCFTLSGTLSGSSCCKGEPVGAARVPTGGVEQKARGTPGSGGHGHPGPGWRAGSEGRCERAGGRRAAACTAPWLRSAVCVHGAAAGPLGGPERPSRASANSAGGVSDVRPRTFLAVVAWRLGPRFRTHGARWQRLARCPEWLDPVVN